MPFAKVATFALCFFSLCFSAHASPAEPPVLYGISPYFLAQGYPIHGLEAVRRRLPEIHALGANVVWLQPVTTPHEGGHGYDVVDFETISPELGTPAELKRLVRDAHALGIKVMLDEVLNHSSSAHPFVRDIASKGEASPYYDYYLHEVPGAGPYSRFLHRRTIGKADFTYYFWNDLLNFNYESSALRAYLIGNLEKRIREFDVDGFRFDASWGPSSRWPGFYAELAGRLRKIKPGLILLAEDKAAYPSEYEGTGHPHLKESGFDWAYDWASKDPDWVSRWSFMIDPAAEETVFNSDNAVSAAGHFVAALREGQAPNGIRTLRFAENNDTPGLLLHHTERQALMAGAAMFLLPGVPLVYYGQETGSAHELFALPSFDPDRKLAAINPKFWSFYQRLIGLRKSSRALAEGSLEELRRPTPTTVSFVRRFERESVRVELRFESHSILVNGKNIFRD